MLPTYSKHIVISDNFDALRDFFASSEYSKIVVLTDTNVQKNCLSKLLGNVPQLQKAPVLEIEPGEENKNIDTVVHLWKTFTEQKADRNVLLVNFGGGVVCDMGGFVASTYKRGVDFINIPTTLLAQVDASVGGKTGVDFNGYKNQIGCFGNAVFTYINPVFLNSLPKKEILSGFAEVIKHALIADRAYFKTIKNVDFSTFSGWTEIIKKSIEIKLDAVGKDPQEKGLRKVLNFGHTIGHALETYFLFSKTRYLHGEAVAQGMIAELYLSLKNTNLLQNEFEDAVGFLHSLYGTCQPFDVVRVMQIMQQDKKNKNGAISFTLLSKIGRAEYDVFVKPDEIVEALYFLQNNS